MEGLAVIDSEVLAEGDADALLHEEAHAEALRVGVRLLLVVAVAHPLRDAETLTDGLRE